MLKPSPVIKPVSFVICFCSNRLDNLSQTLRFLVKREPNLIKKSELILVCQDKIEPIKTHFNKTIHINLNLNYFWKPKMVNSGVDLASNEIIVLLDSDRILPFEYFTNYSRKICFGEFLTTSTMYRALVPLTDHQIETDVYPFDYDEKSENNEMHQKNAFSGNAIFYKQDYLEVGGMDERYVGYGYSDNDFTRLMVSKNKKPIYVNDPELHLFHKYPNLKEYREQNIKNGLFYCSKWGLEPSGILKEILDK